MHEQEHRLMQRLAERYGGDREQKRPRRLGNSTFVADDRGKTDVNAHGEPFSSLCEILVRANGDDSVDVCLRGNIPMDQGVGGWVREAGASLSTVGGPVLEIHIEPGRQDCLKDLAGRIEAVTRPGAPRYPVPSWKYAAPRTAGSLRTLCQELHEGWGCGEGGKA